MMPRMDTGDRAVSVHQLHHNPCGSVWEASRRSCSCIMRCTTRLPPEQSDFQPGTRSGAPSSLGGQEQSVSGIWTTSPLFSTTLMTSQTPLTAQSKLHSHLVSFSIYPSVESLTTRVLSQSTTQRYHVSPMMIERTNTLERKPPPAPLADKIFVYRRHGNWRRRLKHQILRLCRNSMLYEPTSCQWCTTWSKTHTQHKTDCTASTEDSGSWPNGCAAFRKEQQMPTFN